MKEEIESEESRLNLGFTSPVERSIYSIIDAESPVFRPGSLIPGLVGGYSFGVSSDKTKHSRTVFTLLDWLGDVGGLTDALI